MQLSRYLKVYPWEEKPGRLLLYSTKTASKVLISEETFRSIETDSLTPADEALLSRLGMIVDDREEEKQAMLRLPDESNENNPWLNMTVVLNLDCNFSCVYCYEGDMKGDLYMSDSTAEGLLDFIREKFTGDKTGLLIDFYGGEPLLSRGLITYISRAMQSFTEARDASYRFTLVTNGSLFKRRVAEELVPLGLESVKITLDGPAGTHNRSRPFRSGRGSFDTIVRNIKETCDLVKIGIGGNFEEHTYESFVLLLDYLVDEGLTPDKISVVKFDPVTKRPAGDTSPADYKGGCMSIDEPWLVRASTLLREEILKRGYNTPGQTPIRCVIETTDFYVVNYDGVVYKCPAFIGREGFAVGDLQSGIGDYASSYRLGMWNNEECAECEYLPICFGGCRYMTFVKDGNIDSLDCQKAYLDASLETLVKQDIKYGLKAEQGGEGVEHAN